MHLGFSVLSLYPQIFQQFEQKFNLVSGNMALMRHTFNLFTLYLTSDDFTRQGKSIAAHWVNMAVTLPDTRFTVHYFR